MIEIDGLTKRSGDTTAGTAACRADLPVYELAASPRACSDSGIAASRFLSDGTVTIMSAGYAPSSACATGSRPWSSPAHPG